MDLNRISKIKKRISELSMELTECLEELSHELSNTEDLSLGRSYPDECEEEDIAQDIMSRFIN